MRSFDTAPHYGAGLSERRSGPSCRSTRATSTSCPPRSAGCSSTPHEDTEGADGLLRRRPQAAGARLQPRRRAALARGEPRAGSASTGSTPCYVHDPDDYVDEAVGAGLPGARPAARRGRRPARRGRDEPRGAAAADRARDGRRPDHGRGPVHAARPQRGRQLLPLCHERGVRVVAAGVYNSGVLADPRPGAHYDYAPADAATVERPSRLRELCAAHGVPLRAAAVQFPLGHPRSRPSRWGAATRGRSRRRPHARHAAAGRPP